MPASLAGEFTLGEDAALCIVADECRVRGSSDLSLDEIADKASVGRSAAKSALRKARELGLITVQNRGRLTKRCQPSRRAIPAAKASTACGRCARRVMQGETPDGEREGGGHRR